MSASSRRISVGFKGGQVLALRVADEQLAKLYDALSAGGWHEVAARTGRFGSTSGRSSTSARRVMSSASASPRTAVGRRHAASSR